MGSFMKVCFLIASQAKEQTATVLGKGAKKRASQVALGLKDQAASVGDARDSGLILELGRSPGAGNDDALQYSCLENGMDREACGLQSMVLKRVGHG